MFQPSFVPLARHCRILSGLAGLALTAFCFAAFPLSTAHAQIVSLDVLLRNGYGAVPLKRPRPNVLIAEATLDGKSQRLIVDTGANAGTGAIYLPLYAVGKRQTESFEPKIQAASGAHLTGNRTGHAEKVRLGNVEMQHVPLIFSNLPVFLRPNTPDGLLGAPFLRACSAVIDLQNLMLYLRPPGQGRKVMLGAGLRGLNMTEVPMEQGCVNVEINGHRGRMLVDTGAFFSQLDSSRATKMGISSVPSHWGGEDASGKRDRADRAVLQSLKIGDFSAPSPDMLISPLGSFARTGDVVGLLGMDTLGHNGAIIDYSQGKLYLISRR